MRFRRPSRNILLPLILTALAAVTTACGDKSVAQVSHENDAIEIIDVLKEQGFDVSKEEVGEGAAKKWSVVVSEGFFGDDATRAMQVLRDYGLPRPEDKGLEGAYDEQGMFPSESAQRAQRLKELKTEIERQLRMLPGVTRVGVNIVLPEDSTLALNPYPATAGVLILHKDAGPSFTADDVRNLVVGGVSGLKPENVSVTIKQQPPRPPARPDANAPQTQTIIFVIVGVLLIAVLGLGGMWFRLYKRSQRAAAAPADAAAAAPSSESEAGLEDFAAMKGAGGAEELSSAEATAKRQLAESGKAGADGERSKI
jgi:type III secretion protein J